MQTEYTSALNPRSMVKTPAARTRDLITKVAYAYDVTYREVMDPRRDQRVVEARYAAIQMLSHHKPHLSSVQLARIFGRDHSTVLYALGRLTKKRGAL